MSPQNNRVHSADVHRFAAESSGIGGGGRPRSPTVLAEYSVSTDRRGFHGLSHAYIASCCRGKHVTTATALALAGTNLLLNPEATAGATLPQGWDAVTIPGWEVAGGLPTVVRYGTRDFRKPNPGRLTAAISSRAARAVPRNWFSRRR